MTDKTIWTNRLIDWNKIDALTLNLWNKIDAISIWSWNISDAEYEALNWITSNIQAQINNIPAIPLTLDTPKITTDVKFPNWTPSYDGTYVVFTNWTKITKYWTTSQIVFIDWELISVVPMNWVYTAPIMLYDNGLSVNSSTWEIIVSWQRIAYETSSNTFNADTIQTFKWPAIFEGQVSIPFYDIWTQTGNVTFTWSNWMNQKVTLNKVWWTQILSFDKIASWTYELFVVQTWTGTITLWWVSNSWTITSTSKIWATTFPLVLASWSHILVITVANVKAHVWYVWESV